MDIARLQKPTIKTASYSALVDTVTPSPRPRLLIVQDSECPQYPKWFSLSLRAFGDRELDRTLLLLRTIWSPVCPTKWANNGDDVIVF